MNKKQLLSIALLLSVATFQISANNSLNPEAQEQVKAAAEELAAQAAAAKELAAQAAAAKELAAQAAAAKEAARAVTITDVFSGYLFGVAIDAALKHVPGFRNNSYYGRTVASSLAGFGGSYGTHLLMATKIGTGTVAGFSPLGVAINTAALGVAAYRNWDSIKAAALMAKNNPKTAAATTLGVAATVGAGYYFGAGSALSKIAGTLPVLRFPARAHFSKEALFGAADTVKTAITPWMTKKVGLVAGATAVGLGTAGAGYRFLIKDVKDANNNNPAPTPDNNVPAVVGTAALGCFHNSDGSLKPGVLNRFNISKEQAEANTRAWAKRNGMVSPV